ncbi:MAG: hypothetical protein Q9M91_07990 [Candidatus Dojkabacteria bacterium]|nr:hypothetical protein [Candidatus Dojkabacteria bacterium]
MVKQVFIKTQYDSDNKGFFGNYGGAYVPEMLIPALEELENAYIAAKNDPEFLNDLYKNY